MFSIISRCIFHLLFKLDEKKLLYWFQFTMEGGREREWERKMDSVQKPILDNMNAKTSNEWNRSYESEMWQILHFAIAVNNLLESEFSAQKINKLGVRARVQYLCKYFGVLGFEFWFVFFCFGCAAATTVVAIVSARQSVFGVFLRPRSIFGYKI